MLSFEFFPFMNCFPNIYRYSENTNKAKPIVSITALMGKSFVVFGIMSSKITYIHLHRKMQKKASTEAFSKKDTKIPTEVAYSELFCKTISVIWACFTCLSNA